MDDFQCTSAMNEFWKKMYGHKEPPELVFRQTKQCKEWALRNNSKIFLSLYVTETRGTAINRKTNRAYPAVFARCSHKIHKDTKKEWVDEFVWLWRYALRDWFLNAKIPPQPGSCGSLICKSLESNEEVFIVVNQ